MNKFFKVKKASDVTEELQQAIYEAITKVAFNNGQVKDFTKENLQQAFNHCMEKWFEWTDEDGNVLE